MRVHHLAVVVTDLARAEEFYSGTLGLPVIKRWDDRAVWLALEHDVFLALERAGEGEARRDTAPGWHCVALAIDPDEREAWRARIRVERESPHTLYTRDPDGNLVGLSHYPCAAQAPR
jgi:glyoxylase I family protein